MEMGKPKARTYQYDGNGNPLYYEEFKSFRSMVWDEENRLRGINDNGKLHLYTYDHTGERALKSSGESSTVVTNGLTSAVITHMDDYTAYVNPYFVVQKGRFTKHYFEGSARIVSKLGEGTFHHNNRGISAGGIDYIRQSAQMQEARDNYIRGLKVPPGPPTQHGIYASPEWTGQPYPSLGWQNIRQDQEPPEGWPRPPKFNEPGDVPGPPVQYGNPITPQTVKAGYGFIDNGIIEKNLYFYHPDHLGSSSYITDREGRITQHTEYIAFGEVLFEEHSTSKTMPYLFNGKELDSETNLTYFGARYLDMKTSLWLNTDPLSGYNPIQEIEHYIDGQHNGGIYNPMNMATYSYTYQNPIKYIDPNGKQLEAPNIIGIQAHETFANYMRGISGNSGNWVAESYMFDNFRPDLLYYGGKNNISGMGAVWELKPFSQKLPLATSMNSILQVNHYVGELNARREGGLIWAAGTTAEGTPKPFEGNLALSNGKYNFKYYIPEPKTGIIYYNHSLNKEPQKTPINIPVPMPNGIRMPNINSNVVKAGAAVGVGAILLKGLEIFINRLSPIFITTPFMMPQTAEQQTIETL